MDIRVFAKYKFYIGISIIFTVAIVFFVSLGIINNLSVRQVYTDDTKDQIVQESNSTVASITTEYPTSAPIPKRNIDEAINFLNMLDSSDDETFDIYKYAQTKPTVTTNKKMAVHDEQLLQKYNRIRITSEYKDIESKYNRLIAECINCPPLIY